MLIKKTAFFVFFLIFLPLFCYWAALSGPFLFDDFANLEALALIDSSVSLESVKAFLGAQSAGPTGRPIALLSFLLNDYGWPSDPASFKYTNLLIHIVNGLLLLLLVINLSKRFTQRHHGFWLSVIVCGFWVLNPYNVSSVMYVVQRMALLSTFFVFLGLVLYIYGREALCEGKVGRAYLLIASGYAVGAGLGVLAKENAALYVWLVIPVEYLIYNRASRPRILTCLIWLASGVLLIAFIYKVPDFLYQYQWVRDFSLSERLLSQSRALFYYLWRYIIPGVGYVGIYADGFPKSLDLFTPVSTFVTLVGHLLLIFVSWCLRRKLPLFSLGVFFFYLAHSMESSVVPIELMFEHRNYLPSALLLLGLMHIKVRRQKCLMIVLCATLVAVASLLKLQASYWSDQLILKKVFYIENRKSERSAVDYAKLLEDMGEREIALSVLRDYTSREVAGLHVALNQAALACSIGEDESLESNLLVTSPHKYRGKAKAITEKVKRLSIMISRKQCETVDFSTLTSMLNVYDKAYARDATAKQAARVARAYVAFYAGSYNDFKTNLMAAVSIAPNVDLSTSACMQFYQLSKVEDACECVRVSLKQNPGLELHVMAEDHWYENACNN